MNDKLLLEDFIQLLCTYTFNGDEKRLINLWNQAFVPMSNKEKLLVIKAQNKMNEHQGFG